jgi:hypothetical protein
MSQSKLIAIISLPTETFGPFGTMTKTSILVIQKLDKGERVSFNYPVFMANIEDIGYDATGRRTKGQDVQEVLAAWEKFNKDTTKSLDVPRQRAYVTVGEKLQFRWDFKAGLIENSEFNLVPMSKYIDIIKETKNLEKQENETFPYLSIQELPENPFIIKTINNIPGSKLYGPKNIAKGGDILFARLGPSMANRKSLIIDKSIDKLYCSNEFHVLRPKLDIPPEFVLYLIKSDSFITQAQSKARGATPSRLRLYEEDLLNIRVPSHSPDEIKNKGTAYLEGRIRASALMEEAEIIIGQVSPDF